MDPVTSFRPPAPGQTEAAVTRRRRYRPGLRAGRQGRTRRAVGRLSGARGRRRAGVGAVGGRLRSVHLVLHLHLILPLGVLLRAPIPSRVDACDDVVQGLVLLLAEGTGERRREEGHVGTGVSAARLAPTPPPVTPAELRTLADVPGAPRR